jgi:cysteine desulfurase
MMDLPVYLDHNATTPCDPLVVEAMLPYFSQRFGNAASRSHSFGWEASEAVDLAREQVASLVGAEPNEIVFTSGATESVNLALKGMMEAYASKGNHIITSKIEHKAVLDSCKHLEKMGADITYLPVNAAGIIDLAQLEASIKKETILIALMYANNEIGTIMPVKEISAIARKHSVIFFTDAAQAAGKIPVDVNEEGIDLMAFTSHKLYGPKGVGALYVRRRDPRVKLIAQLDGGGHEKGMRSGTLNVPGIVGFGKAAEIAKKQLETDAARIGVLRDKLEQEILKMEHTSINGSGSKRLPHVSNISFKFIEGDNLLTELNRFVAVSSGSACTSASLEPSYVLKALGLDDDLAYGSIRFSLGRSTTEAEIDLVIEKVVKTVQKLREINPEWENYRKDIRKDGVKY